MAQNKNLDLLILLKKYECRDSTYIATDPAMVFSRAHGSTVYDAEGKPYVDLCAGFGVHALGHNADEILKVILESINENRVMHAMGDVYPSSSKILLLKNLIEVMPSQYTKAALALSGSQAVEIAMKTAIFSTKKHGFICFSGGYHGLDFGALSVTHRADFREPFLPLLNPNAVKFIAYSSEIEVLRMQFAGAVNELVQSGYGLAGVIVEPVQGRAGIKIAREGWLIELRDLTSKANALLIFDEIYCGLGRCGKISFADEVSADISCFGKALGGGLPLSACVGTTAAMDAWAENSGEALHTGTFFGHPLSCELGSAVIAAIQERKLCERAKELGTRAIEFLQSALKDSRDVCDVRGEGLMIGIEFVPRNYAVFLMDKLRKEGIIALPSGADGRVLSITPPLTISESELFETLDKIIAEIL